MTQHDHTEIVPDCFRCALSEDEVTDQQQPGASEQEKSVYTTWSSQQPAGFFYRPDLVFKAGRDSLRAQLAETREEVEMWRGHYSRVLTDLAAIKGHPDAIASVASERDEAQAELDEARAEVGLLKHDREWSQQYMGPHIDRLEAEVERMRTALKDALELAEDAIPYVSEHLQQKWGYAEELAKLHTVPDAAVPEPTDD